MAVTDGLCEPVTCTSCGAVSVNGGTLHCHRCYTDAQAENVKLKANLIRAREMALAHSRQMDEARAKSRQAEADKADWEKSDGPAR